MGKCPHGVYTPGPDGTANYCSLCTPVKPLTEAEANLFPKHRPMTLYCPECGQVLAYEDYKSDYEFSCRSCGFEY